MKISNFSGFFGRNVRCLETREKFGKFFGSIEKFPGSIEKFPGSIEKFPGSLIVPKLISFQ